MAVRLAVRVAMKVAMQLAERVSRQHGHVNVHTTYLHCYYYAGKPIRAPSMYAVRTINSWVACNR